MIKKVFKTAFWTITIIPLVFLMCSCWLIPTYHHRPHYLYQTDVIFEDSNGNVLFEKPGSILLSVFVPSSDLNYYNGFTFPGLNYEGGAANSKYFVARLVSISDSLDRCFIRIFDKSFNIVKTITFSNGEKVHGIACSENYLYIYLEKLDFNKASLIRYSFAFDSISILVEDLKNSKSYQDEDIHLFFAYNRYYFKLCKYGDTKTCLYNPIYESNGSHRKTDKIDLSLFRNGKNLVVENESEVHTLDLNLDLASNHHLSDCHLYSKAYLIDDQLVFAIYKESTTQQCETRGGCICSLQESYLYKYDLASNELSLVKEFEKGTFLIDYGLDGYKYYKDGGLYINDVLFRECENIYPEYVEHLTNEEKMFYYFSYYNGEFYGI